MKFFRIILFMSILFAATSCIVGPTGSFYKPIYPDSSVEFEGGWCHGAAGPPAVIKLSLEGGVNIRVRLDSNKHESLRLRLKINVPLGASVQFAANQIKLTDLNSGKEWAKEVQQMYLFQFGAIPIPATAAINFDEIGTTTSMYVPENVPWQNFGIRVPFSISNYYPRAVKVYLPNIVAINKEYEIPVIELVEDEEKKEQNRINAKGQQRRWWWPYKAKKNKDGSWVNINGFIVGGGVSGGYIDNEFGGNFNVSFPPAVKWRFTSNSIRIVDLDTNEEHFVSFDHVTPVFDLNLTFTALVIGNRASRKIWASANITVSEKLLESIVVQLPSVFINGKEIHIKPITFKKSIGFGIIPFNC